MNWLQGLLWISVFAILGLTFVWPYAVSPDPAHEAFKTAAITAFIAFFTFLLAALIARLAARS